MQYLLTGPSGPVFYFKHAYMDVGGRVKQEARAEGWFYAAEAMDGRERRLNMDIGGRAKQEARTKGLELFFKTGRKSGIQAKHVKRLQLILGRLNAATSPDDMSLPGLFLHPLTGNRANVWSVRVSGNWRVTFRFNGAHAEVVDYEDYH